MFESEGQSAALSRLLLLLPAVSCSSLSAAVNLCLTCAAQQHNYTTHHAPVHMSSPATKGEIRHCSTKVFRPNVYVSKGIGGNYSLLVRERAQKVLGNMEQISNAFLLVNHRSDADF